MDSYRQTKNFYVTNKIQSYSRTMHITLTEKGYLGQLQFTTVQLCFVSTLGHRKTN